MKDAGIAAVCAQIVAKGATTITEHELVEAVSKVAADANPELSPAQAFAKVFTASTDEGRTLRQAVALAKAASWSGAAPVFDPYAAADPREKLWQNYKSMRDRGELAEKVQEPKLRDRIAELEAENTALRGVPAAPQPSPLTPPTSNVLTLPPQPPAKTAPVAAPEPRSDPVPRGKAEPWDTWLSSPASAGDRWSNNG
jgi:hypothetical protein